MIEPKTLYYGGYLPCLHCGETIEMDGEIHICNKKLDWLNKQNVALVQLPTGEVWDLRNKCLQEHESETEKKE